MSIDKYFEEMWENYLELIPQASKICSLLEGEGEKIFNDHIALRTFNLEETNVEVISGAFLKLGYKEKGEYHFKEKKLYAKHFEYPGNLKPKVFISELLLENFSEDFQAKIKSLVSSQSKDFYKDEKLMLKGRPWDISIKEFEMLRNESEYGAWVAALGFRPNHFTISINHLEKYKDILELNKFLKASGFKLNDSGGEVKGTVNDYLEQSSTLADSVEVKFSDGKKIIPSCYFEFAKRYPMEDGKLYTGFVAKSADKIFESTDKGQ